MNQTPYSLHFSRRKKFSKQLTPTDFPSLQETEIDLLRQALLNTTNEYQTLFTAFQAEHEAKSNLEIGNLNLSEALSNEKIETNVKALKKDYKSISEKYENKSLDYNQPKLGSADCN